MQLDAPARQKVLEQAAALRIENAALLAVISVESNGQVYAAVAGRNEPLIRWEGHYFDARLKGEARQRARDAGLAHPTAGKIKNPRSQTDRWRLLAKAMEIDAQAALESVSWGVGQVMGAHWKALGFASVGDLVNMARSGAAGQIEIMVRYIKKFGLVDELQRLDFAGFARGYNGPNYAAGGYHTKMAAEYERNSGRSVASAATGMLRMGSTGARVRDLQVLLGRAGYAVKVDGDFGPSTKDAVRRFQASEGITADGVVGPETVRRLDLHRQSVAERPGAQALFDIPEVKSGVATGFTGGVTLEGASQMVQQASDRISFVPGLEKLSAILTVVAIVLILGGMAYAAIGWWRSGRTDEGDIPT